ncbi:Malic acid transport protein [Cytospora mali]|uniref:Malic acid transport protein n=1 Tax=Cytospora mali TaxID=578113 RepID=A0A194UXD6_CYTMA|nr:Malic acid transport protein [Valsa mali var. pyri (nom. inval.)]
MEGSRNPFGGQNTKFGHDNRLDLNFSTYHVSQGIPLQDRPRFSPNDVSNLEIDSNEPTRVSTPNNEEDREKLQQGGKHLEGETYMGYNIYDPQRPKLSLKQRLNHFTWAWWTLIMSTGGLSLLIYAQPYQFPGLRQIGLAVYIINLVLFILVFSATIARFVLFTGTFKASICHAREGLFVPTFFLSFATLITSTYRYAVPADNESLNYAIRVAFWTYLAATLVLAVGQYSYVFRTHSLEVKSMMPTWILPIFPIMLSGTIASVVSDTQPDSMSVSIVYSGLACQGLGISVSFLMYAHMVGRLMQYGLPNREHRPGLFMNVGPPSFTCLAFIGMSNGLPDDFDFDSNGVMDIHFVRQVAVLGGVYLWGLALWWWGVAIIAVVSSRPKYFHLGWWASVFPNTGFTLATITLGKAIGSEFVLKFAVFMSVCILLTYSFVLYHNIRAVLVQDIMYPGRDEDVVEH